jgi:CO/xanthine dehydrogenase Mo-binding subunit
MAASDTIGVPRPRTDSEPKVRGATRYTADLPVHGLLHGRLVLAADAHARLTRIDADAALAVPGVVAVLTAADLPIAAASGTARSDEPLAREEILFAGQPVAIVLAESEAAAADGVDEVIVEAEPLPAIVDLEAGMAPDSPIARVTRPKESDEEGMGGAHASVGGSEGQAEEEEELSENVVGRMRMRSGDAEAALAASDAVASARFRTGWIHQAYVEPQAATAWLEPDGQIVISSSTQGAFVTRQGVANLLGLPHDRVRVRPAPLGGAFGGKFMLLEPLVAAAAVRVRRPVRLAFTRIEDFAAANPAPGQILELEAGANRDGTLTAIRGRVIADRGSFEDFPIEQISALLAAGPYRWQAHDLAGYGVLTNRFGAGAYRAPGAPPAAFAVESLIDELAEKLELDAIELRLANIIREGDTGLDGQPFPVFGAAECLERLRDHPLWQGRADLPDGEGVGIGIGWWPGGLEPAAAACRLDADGGVTVITGAVDMSGTDTTFQTIAAAAFGVPYERVRVVAGDTSSTAFAGASGGSKVTYTIGRAVERAAAQARERLLDVAAEKLEIAPEDLELVDGVVRPVGTPSRGIEINALAKEILSFDSPYAPVEGYGGVAQKTRAPGTAAHLARVRVDRETGAVTPLEHVVVQDVGRALNPALVEGQLMGGTAQGYGWALHEELVHDEDGQLRTGSFVEYGPPSASGVPPIETMIVEVPAPDGPYGAKGIGEPPVIAVAAAVANAIHAATGARVRELPMTAQRVWRALS